MLTSDQATDLADVLLSQAAALYNILADIH